MAKSDDTRDPYTDTAHTAQGQAERLAHSLGESAQQVWLAGLGALGRAQTESSRLFDTLVQEGQTMERNTREFTDRQSEAARSSLEGARGRAFESWGRIEHAFEDRVQRTLSRMGVPVREDLAELNRRIDELTAQLRRANAGSHAATAKKATRSNAHASPVKKATARKTVRRAGATSPAADD